MLDAYLANNYLGPHQVRACVSN